jgi:exodeoxyribonuclease V beta subunit
MSFDISSRHEILTQRLFVEASAGTGKTFVIEHYLVRSILTVPFHPEKLALITFTKAVARELRLRLRATLQATLASIVAGEESFQPTSTSRLESYHHPGPTSIGITTSSYLSSPFAHAAQLQGQKDEMEEPQGLEDHEHLGTRHSCAFPPDYLQDILEQDALGRSRAARTIEEVLEQLGDSTIATIHGFCDRLLKGWGEETGNGIVEEWIGEEEKKKWLEEFLQEGAGLRCYELRVVSKRYFHDQNKLIAHLIKRMDEIEGREDKAWEEAEKAIADVKEKIRGRKISAALSAKAKGYRGNMKKDGFLKEEIAKAFDAIQDIVENGLIEENLELLADFSLPERFATPLIKMVECTVEEEDIVNLVLVELWTLLRELVDGDSIVRRLAERSAKAFMVFVIGSGRKTPDMVVRRVLELSGEGKFLAYAAEAVDWLIVDEFQDTDAVQYAIFSRLFLNNPLWHGHVLFVGDPKQAIYGFRKADVYSYLAARKSLLPHEIRTLAVNYRAERYVVEAQNRLFAGPEHPWVFFLPRMGTSLEVVPCGVGKEPQPPIGDGRGALHLLVARHHLGRKRRWPHDEMEQQELFPWLADEMIALESRGVAFRQQAILVKDRYQAKRVQQFLEERSIPTCAWRVDAVTDSPIYQWLKKAFSLAIRPNDPRRLSSLLLAMPTDYHLTLCHAMASDRRLDQWAACAIAWSSVRDAFQEGGVSAMARALLTCRWNGRDTAEEWLSTMPQGETLLVDIEHLFELLSLLDPVLPHSIEAYGDALENITSHFSEDIEMLTRRVDPDDEGAPILTMHRSKGLEFDVVYALGCANRTPPQDDIAIDEADAEKLRQLYVAITRAKRRCYLPLLIDDDEKLVPLGQASPVELLCAALSSQGNPSPSWTSTLYQSMASASRLSLASTLCHDLPHIITMSEAAAEQRRFSFAKKFKHPSAITALPKLSWSSRSYRSFTSEGDEGDVLPPSTPGQETYPLTPSWSTAITFSMADTKENVMAVAPLQAATLPAEEKENTDDGGMGSLLMPCPQQHSPLFGIRFHETIARLLFAPPEARASIDGVTRWLKRKALYDAEMAQLLYDAVRVRVPMGSEMVCLDDVPRGDMRVECSFLDKDDGDRYVRGVIDLVLLWKGAVYVIDWKTHAVEGECREVVEQRYELQHSLYLQAVMRAFAPRFRYGGFFFIFVRHLDSGGIVANCEGGNER